MARLALRGPGVYGASPEERARVARHIGTVEPLLQRSTSLEIDTRRLLNDVLAEVLRAAGETAHGV